MPYVIKLTCDDLFWSCNYGWSDLDSADQYSHEEHMCLDLPMEGEWRILTEEGLEDA